MIKLREFRKNLDPVEYLQTEHRQNLKDLNKILTSFDFFVRYFTNFNNTVTIYGASPTVMENTAVPNYFDITDSLVVNGKIRSNVYYPQYKGRYWIEYGCRFTNDVPNAGNAEVFPVDQLGKQLSGSTTLIWNGSTPTKAQTSGAFFADLSPELGVAFNGVSSAIGHKIQNLFFKITKVG